MEDNISQILELLKKRFPSPKTELENWSTPFQFLVCVILSAQATDKGVNKITKELFEKFPDIENYLEADPEVLAQTVKSINYYKTKAKRIIDAALYVKKEYGGKLPKEIGKLIKIPGIGRKSANVILNEVFNLSQGVVVDTHVTRVSQRLGLTTKDDQKDAEKIEQELINIIPPGEWQFYSGAAVLLGRYICKAKKPLCDECPLNKVCPSAYKV